MSMVAAMVNGDVYKRETALTALIHTFVPAAVLVEDTNSELTYQLPDDRRHTQLFQDLFISLDDNIKSLGFSSYGISDTTLEEVGIILCAVILYVNNKISIQATP